MRGTYIYGLIFTLAFSLAQLGLEVNTFLSLVALVLLVRS